MKLTPAQVMASLRQPSRWRAWEIAAWVLIWATPLVFAPHAALINEIAILALFALSLDLILGYAGIVSLGHAAFFGLGLDVRHVTLSTGQIGVASATLGMDVLHQPAFWWAVAMVPFNGALNVLVSFYLAFRLALRAHNVGSVDRARIYRALLARWRSAPLGFFLPPRRTV